MQFSIILDHPTLRFNVHDLVGASLSNVLVKPQVPRGRKVTHSAARSTTLASVASSAALGAGAVEVDEYGSGLHICLGLGVDFVWL